MSSVSDRPSDEADVSERGEIELVLARVPLFASLSDAERRSLSRAGVVRDLPPGETVAEPAGTSATGAVVVLHGELVALRPASPGVSRQVRVLSAGAVVNELSLVGVPLGPVTVRSVRASRIFVLEPVDLARLADRRDPAALAIGWVLARELARRMTSQEAKLDELLARHDALLEVIESLLEPEVMRELMERTGATSREDLAKFKDTLTHWDF